MFRDDLPIGLPIDVHSGVPIGTPIELHVECQSTCITLIYIHMYNLSPHLLQCLLHNLVNDVMYPYHVIH